MTLREAVKQYLNYCTYERKLSPETAKAYRIDLEQFLGFLKARYPLETDVHQITRQILREYLVSLNNSLAVSSVKRKTACLKSFFRYLEEEELIHENPFDKIHMKVKEPVKVPDVMTLEEVERMLSAVYENEEVHANSSILGPESIRLRDIAVIEFLFATGIRVKELCILQWTDIDMHTGIVKISGKGNKERNIYVENKYLLDILESYHKKLLEAGVDAAVVFVNKFGQKLSSQAVRNMITKYKEKAGITKNITPHTFRHTFASLLLEEGVDIKYIQEFLGHSSISTTQIYLHVSASAARAVLREKHPREKITLPSLHNVKLCSEGGAYLNSKAIYNAPFGVNFKGGILNEKSTFFRADTLSCAGKLRLCLCSNF